MMFIGPLVPGRGLGLLRFVRCPERRPLDTTLSPSEQVAVQSPPPLMAAPGAQGPLLDASSVGDRRSPQGPTEEVLGELGSWGGIDTLTLFLPQGGCHYSC